ncbi:hypothetical protein ACSBR1_037068 [Camellia fascicularis]
MRLVTYADIVDRAMIVERNVNSRKKFTEKKKRRFDNFDEKKSSDFPSKNRMREHLMLGGRITIGAIRCLSVTLAVASTQENVAKLLELALTTTRGDT